MYRGDDVDDGARHHAHATHADADDDDDVVGDAPLSCFTEGKKKTSLSHTRALADGRVHARTHALG